jgi:hypothetical protein
VYRRASASADNFLGHRVNHIFIITLLYPLEVTIGLGAAGNGAAIHLIFVEILSRQLGVPQPERHEHADNANQSEPQKRKRVALLSDCL